MISFESYFDRVFWIFTTQSARSGVSHSFCSIRIKPYSFSQRDCQCCGPEPPIPGRVRMIDLNIIFSQHCKFKIQWFKIADKFIYELLPPFYIEQTNIFITLLQTVSREEFSLDMIYLLQTSVIIFLFGFDQFLFEPVHCML